MDGVTGGGVTGEGIHLVFPLLASSPPFPDECLQLVEDFHLLFILQTPPNHSFVTVLA